MERDAHLAAVGRFRHLRELGRGAMGVVDLVYDEVRGSPVARKRMHQPSSESRFRLKQEFRQAQEVRHPNLVRLYDLFADEGDAFFTMEPIFGTDIGCDVASATERFGSGSAEVTAIIADRLRQLVDAVAALHATGIVHRDIKPSNVLVEDNGRLVLLDFGFCSLLASDFKESEDRALVGTIPYMAPECLWGAQPSTGSDWYSVGVIAAELCLGRRLFSGPLQQVLREKDRPPESLRAWAPGLPPALDELICALLRRDPSARPDDATPLRGALGSSGAPRAATTVSGIASVFVGRAAELEQLEHRIGDEARAQIVRVHGPSGIGKTALLRELTARLSRRPSWVVFRGRCHPREQLALKALDSVIDEVSRHLKQLGPRVCARMAALEGMPALIHMFPVLARVPEFNALDRDAGPADLQARWIDAVRAFRALWSELAARDRVAVWIDDLQWADKDGLRLLHEVVSVEPRPPIAWLLSYRSASVAQGDAAEQLFVRVPEGSFELPLSGLGRADATELAIRLGASRQVAGEVEQESGGSPFIISELTRSVLSGGGLTSVAAVIEDRLLTLEPEELAIAEHLALAEGPLPLAVVRELFSARVAVVPALERLENARLVRLSYAGGSEEFVEAHHDRIRESVAGRMSEAARRAGHLRLADAWLLSGDAPRAAIAFHCRRAGDLERGLALTLEAAEECSRALAFEQAAQLYEEALAIHPDPTPVDILERAANALARAGRCEDAARRFLDAAARVPAGARHRQLQLQAGAHFLYAGQIGQGRSVLEKVLREHGLGWPKAPRLSSNWQRARLLLGGVAELGELRPASAEQAERFDALWAVAKGTVMVEPAAGDALALNALHEALRLRDPSRLVWTLGHEAASEANIGGPYLRRKSGALLEQVVRLAEAHASAYDRAYLRMVQGVIQYFRGEFSQAEEGLRETRRLYRDGHTGPIHEQNIAVRYLIAALEQQGNVRDIMLLLPELRASAKYTGNLYTSFLFQIASAGLVALAGDHPFEAIEQADAALAAWPMTRFTSQHHYHFQVTLAARLYAGQAREAWEQVERTWPLLQRANFLRLETFGMQHRHLRARAALLMAGQAVGSVQRWVRIAATEAAAIGRSTLPQADPIRAALESGVASVSGRWPEARTLCEAAVDGFDRAGMLLARETARLRLANLCAEEHRSRALEEQARSWLLAAGVRNPDAIASALVPGAKREQ